MADGKSEQKFTDHLSAWAALVAALVALVLGYLNRQDLADSKRDFERQIKLFDDKMTGLSSVIEKSHKLEVSPRLQFESLEEGRVQLGENSKLGQLRLKNIGRGHAYKVFVDVIVNEHRFVTIPEENDIMLFETSKNQNTNNQPERLVENKTITKGGSIDGLHISNFGQSPKDITSVGGYFRVGFTDDDGIDAVEIQPFALMIIPINGNFFGWLELPYPQREQDWHETPELFLRELSKARQWLMMRPAPILRQRNGRTLDEQTP